VQSNGVSVTVVRVPAGSDEIRGAALSDEKVRGAREGKTVRKVIVVGKLVNIGGSSA